VEAGTRDASQPSGPARADVAALIPAFRAAATLAAVVRGARAHCARVIVVDDGSDDGTGAAAVAAGAELLRHPTNRGKGAALRTGLEALAADGVARALTLDADGQHLPAEIPVLLAASDRAPEAIVVGERRKTGHQIARANRFGNWIADRLLHALAGRRLPDTQSGFRVYPVRATLALGVRGRRYDFETEVLLLAARRGMVLVGVPVRVHYPPVATRVSHFRKWRDTLRIVTTVLRVLAARRPGPARAPARGP
jgi:glycosyltransferase involved in cell wall biosynthesis